MESLYRRHRFPPEIISHAAWLYYRFSLSFWEVEELFAERRVGSGDSRLISGRTRRRADSGTL